MNKKIGIGIVVIAIVVASMFVGCVEEETPEAAYPTPTTTPTPTPTPTPEATESPTPTSTPTSTPVSDVEGIKSNAVVIPYDDLFRNNENHIGKIVYFQGNIVQIQESNSNRYLLRVATKNGYEDIIWVNYEGERLLEDDIIDVWSEVKGLRTYEAVLGNAVTVPEIESLKVELVTITETSKYATPKYSIGDVIGVSGAPKYSDTAKFVYEYDGNKDQYRIVDINRIYGIWVYYGSIFRWRSRESVERDYPNKYDSVDFFEVMGYDEYWDSEYRTWMDGYVLPIDEKERESWYEILKFSGDKWDEGRTKPFAIKGEQWSIKAEMSGTNLCRNIYLYREGETEKHKFQKYLVVRSDYSDSSERDYWREFVHGSGNYYLKIEAIEVGDPGYYGIRESGEWEIIIDEYY